MDLKTTVLPLRMESPFSSSSILTIWNWLSGDSQADPTHGMGVQPGDGTHSIP